MPSCSNIQRSLAWCQGTPVLPGVRRRLYYISKELIVQWPQFERNADGKVVSPTLSGSFVLAADASWKYIDILPEKSQLTSEAQGESPSQTQLNKLTAVHPGVGGDASLIMACLNNDDNVFIVQDMNGRYRIVGSEKWQTKCTVAQDLGQGATGSASTTITVEATDEAISPFYVGNILTEDGTITGTSTGSGSGSSSGSGSGSSSGSGAGMVTITLSVEGNDLDAGYVQINNETQGRTVSKQVSPGTSVTIKALPNGGYDFYHWSDHGTGTVSNAIASTAVRTFVVNQNVTLTATILEH